MVEHRRLAKWAERPEKLLTLKVSSYRQLSIHEEVDVDVPGKIDMKRPLAMATLHFLALVDNLESIGEQALHGTGRRWSVLTTNSVAKLSQKQSSVGLCSWLIRRAYGICRRPLIVKDK